MWMSLKKSLGSPHIRQRPLRPVMWADFKEEPLQGQGTHERTWDCIRWGATHEATGRGA